MRKVQGYWFLVCILIGLACSGGGGGGTEPGPKPPVILSGPMVSGIAVSSATVEWTTDKASNSVVRYGRTTAYGDSVRNQQLVTSHTVGISGLAALTRYYYEVSSEDADGYSVASPRKTFVTMSPVGELVEEGWNLFEQGSFESALARFEDAYGYEPQNVGVLEGLGWTFLRLYSLDESVDDFESALSREPGRLDCLSGIALAYTAAERYDDAIAAADHLLSAGGTYVFTHDDEIRSSDIRYCLILALAANGDLIGALDQAKILDPAIGLDPDDRSTWDGYSSFEEAMLMLIEGLREKV